MVLPSYKRGPFKLYAGKGVWLDMLLTYAKGQFHPTAWAFEDFKRNPYQHDLQLIREKFKKLGRHVIATPPCKGTKQFILKVK